MKQFKYVITDEVGLHARPAGLLAKKAKEMKGADVTVTVSCNGKSADATKLMAIMGMGVKKDMEADYRISGCIEAFLHRRSGGFLRWTDYRRTQ